MQLSLRMERQREVKETEKGGPWAPYLKSWSRNRDITHTKERETRESTDKIIKIKDDDELRTVSFWRRLKFSKFYRTIYILKILTVKYSSNSRIRSSNFPKGSLKKTIRSTAAFYLNLYLKLAFSTYVY